MKSQNGLLLSVIVVLGIAFTISLRGELAARAASPISASEASLLTGMADAKLWPSTLTFIQDNRKCKESRCSTVCISQTQCGTCSVDEFLEPFCDNPNDSCYMCSDTTNTVPFNACFPNGTGCAETGPEIYCGCGNRIPGTCTYRTPCTLLDVGLPCDWFSCSQIAPPGPELCQAALRKC